MKTYNIGFTVNGINDETQFDTKFENHWDAIVDVMNCFLGFIKENKFENVEITYIEQVEELTEKEIIQNAIWDLEYAVEFMQCEDIVGDYINIVGASDIESKLDDMRNSIERLYEIM